MTILTAFKNLKKGKKIVILHRFLAGNTPKILWIVLTISKMHDFFSILKRVLFQNRSEPDLFINNYKETGLKQIKNNHKTD